MSDATTTHITTSGGLLTAAFVEALREPGARQRGLAPEEFALPGQAPPHTPADVEATVAAAWELLLERWDAVRAEFPTLDVSQVRARWLIPLFKVLDFDPVYVRGDTVVDENEALRFPLSHRGWDPDGPVLHMTPGGQDLDARPASSSGQAGAGRGYKAKSPHDMLQAFLNVSRDDTWALLTNGVFLRLLRTYHHTFTKGYVQFDLEAIFETRNYGDFRALYRMCHASRFPLSIPPTGGEEKGGEYPLEWFYQDALATGIKVGEDLRGQVRTAIEALGNGFLDGDLIQLLTGQREGEKANVRTDHESRMTDDGLRLTQTYYAEILHIVYRILFLLFAEQRGLLPNAGAPLADLYREQYSITALRSRAEGDVPQADPFHDLWEGLKVTFAMLNQGAPDLGVFGYDGMLFAEGQTPILDGTFDKGGGARLSYQDEGQTNGVGANAAPPPSPHSISNSDVLRAIRALTLIERGGVLQRISYADLGVEELGAIYESLLDYTPRVTTAPESIEGRDVPAHTFILDPRGMARKTSGSYYTHPSLVNELIKSALLPVIETKVRRGHFRAEVRSRRFSAVTHGDKSPTMSESPTTNIDYAALTPEQRAAAEDALLAIRICDPAAGSGHFLVKANNVLGAALARVRTGDDYPTEAAVQAAKRDVLAHCIYAVDLNPMAVELCKVSLWINASVRDAPLNFLDHHIRCGNSLVGADPALLEDGIPYAAFALGRVGDDREVAKALRAQNRDERRAFEKSGATQMGLFRVQVYEPGGHTYTEYRRVDQLAAVDPQAARERFAAYQADAATARAKLVADTWTAAFFWPLTPDAPPPPTFNTFREVQARGKDALSEAQQRMVAALAEKHHFFHWYLAFPDVFEEAQRHGDESPTTNKTQAGSGHFSAVHPPTANGFDVILGNPPWERIKLQEKEFFGERSEPASRAIAEARTAAARRKLIRALPKRAPALHAAYVDALHSSEALSSFLRESGRYPLSAQGDINTYQVFAGLVRQLVGAAGRAGVVLPTGIATDFYNKDFFAALVTNRELVSLYDFENRAKLFSEVDSRFKFSLVTLTGAGAGPAEADFAFFLHQTADLDDAERRFALSADDLARINPNTQTCPVFRTRRDATLTRKLYRAAPVLVNEATGENPWGVSFLRMFDMTNDSNLFHTREQLETEGYILDGNWFVREKEVYLPLYESKMFWHFDHRFGTYEGVTSRSDVHLTNPTYEQYMDPNFVVLPWYWVPELATTKRLGTESRWFVAFRDITNSTNERTGVFNLLPWTALSNKAPALLIQNNNVLEACAFLANLNSIPFDFVVRQKMGGTSLNFFIVKQLPVLPPETYAQQFTHHASRFIAFIVPRVLELTYTAWDLRAFADDVWAEADPALRDALLAQWEACSRRFIAVTSPNIKEAHGAEAPTTNPHGAEAPTTNMPTKEGFPRPPFTWDAARRAELRADLDALYAHLYGLTREELAYILDTFPIVKRKDEEKYGEYRTKRMVLEKYDMLKDAPFVVGDLSP